MNEKSYAPIKVGGISEFFDSISSTEDFIDSGNTSIRGGIIDEDFV